MRVCNGIPMRYVLFFLLNTFSIAVFSAIRTWDGSSSSAFNTGANWSGNTMPGSGDDAVMNNTGNAPLLDMSRSVTNFTINSGTFDLGGNTLTITGNATFTAGTITNGTILINGTGTTTFTGTTFNANVTLTVTASNIYFNGGTFHCNVTATNNTSGTNNCNGGCVFNGNVTLIMPGTGDWRLGYNTAADDFNGNLYIRKTVTTTGSVRVGQVYGATVAGNLDFTGTVENTCMGCAGGVITLDGTTDQYIYGSSSYLNIIQNLTVNKSAGRVYLDQPLTIDNGVLTLTSGIIVSTTTSYVHFENYSAALAVSGGSDNSYIDGPARFYDGFAAGGVQLGSFTFPIGDGGHIFPIEISASDATIFQAEAIDGDPDATYSRSSKDGTLDHINKQMYWKLDRTSGTSNVTVKLHWNANSGGISTLADLRVARWNGTTWKDHGNGATTGNTTAGTVASSAAVTSFSPFALASTSTNNPLPVDMLSFNAVNNNNQTVSVNWQTASEINSDYFELQRSSDLTNWRSLTHVASAGNSTATKNYFYLDKEPTTKNYYRLTQFDLDGIPTEYGPVYVELDPIDKKEATIKYVQPNKLTYYIPTPQQVSIELINVLGQTVRQIMPLQPHAAGTYIIDAGNLGPGVQFIRMNFNDSSFIEKVVGF